MAMMTWTILGQADMRTLVLQNHAKSSLNIIGRSRSQECKDFEQNCSGPWLAMWHQSFCQGWPYYVTEVTGQGASVFAKGSLIRLPRPVAEVPVNSTMSMPTLQILQCGLVTGAWPISGTQCSRNHAGLISKVSFLRSWLTQNTTLVWLSLANLSVHSSWLLNAKVINHQSISSTHELRQIPKDPMRYYKLIPRFNAFGMFVYVCICLSSLLWNLFAISWHEWYEWLQRLPLGQHRHCPTPTTFVSHLA